MSDERLKVWVLSDGRAGHVNQSKGILAALGIWATVEEEWIEVRLRAGLVRRIMDRVLAGNGGRSLKWLRRFCRLGDLPEGAPDLIVSAGGNTRHANAWLAKSLACRNVFCGDLRGLGEGLFAGVITWDESKRGQDGWMVSATPVSITPGGVEDRAERWREAAGFEGARIWTLLVGGDGAGYRWGREDFEGLGAMLKRYHESHRVRWVVVTSRRTGREAEGWLRESVADGVMAGWSIPDAADAVPYAAALGAGQRVFVTEDSHMMITEAIASGRPVHTVRPATCEPDESNLHFLNLYEGEGWISRHGLDVEGELPGLTVLREGTVERLGRQLREWWEGGSGAA